jgi:ATPase family protein associated with various cellular activities (AAA)
MNIDDIFDSALRHPSPGFVLGKRLAEMFPDLAMIEAGTGLFFVPSFASAGHCTVEARPELYHQYETFWDSDEGVFRRALCQWATVTWQDTSFELVKLTYPTRYHDDDRQYLLGKDPLRCRAFFEAVCKWNHEVRGEILVFTGGCFTKSPKLFEAVAKASFEQLVLDGALEQQIRTDFSQFLASREAYEAHGVPWKRGALFIGPPGNGKTLCVKALIRELGIPCLYVQSFEAQHSTVQASIEAVFKRARETTPCILVLEDIDALLVEGSRSFFLNELDGFASNTGVITLATTNHPERLDPSIVERPSRFDRKYHFDLPTPEARGRYIANWNARLAPALQLTADGRAKVVELTADFSYAYVQEVFVSSMMRWMTTRDPQGILPVALEQIELLRAQMKS